MLRAIGVTIRAYRRHRGLSQEALADLAQIDRSYMSSIERGLRNVSVLNVARIAVALQVPLCDLLQAKGALPSRASGHGPAIHARVRPLPVPWARGEPSAWEPGRYLSLG